MTTVHLGKVAHLLGNPIVSAGSLELIEAGALFVDDQGIIQAVGRQAELLSGLASDVTVIDHGDSWLIPGLVDGHLHFPQYFAMAAANHGLLSWLRESVFPAEARFQDLAFARQVAEQLVQSLLRGGVTTASIFGSQFPGATRALFEAARARGLRMIAGMTLMDQGGPQTVLQQPSEAFDHCQALIEEFQDHPRLGYAIQPRFALACSAKMLTVCGNLARDNPNCYIQTHVNESQEEIAAVSRAYPDAPTYLDVYDRHGLLGSRTLLIHNIHVQSSELERIAEAGAAVCHCPSSNLFLGSGLFPLGRHVSHSIPLALGTDIGAGLNLSVWEEAADAYKIQQLQHFQLDESQLLYWLTLGGAKALGLDQKTGNFEPGKSADFIVVSPRGDPYLHARLDFCENLSSQLFVLLQLAKRQHFVATYVQGAEVDFGKAGDNGR